MRKTGFHYCHGPRSSDAVADMGEVVRQVKGFDRGLSKKIASRQGAGGAPPAPCCRHYARDNLGAFDPQAALARMARFVASLRVKIMRPHKQFFCLLSKP
ncbi:hypothetical protein [Methylocystis sp. B8]|uniref:hypothetical protein n=1 Tax=Methylocystis sp. B8 TaxID=544938 RepID=UPI0010FE5F66|nr:hypothetical protein [Methylocystis sp. B8]TLG74001.1 hypothetical protein FEV16_12155 [Methylocystis sp. B8]